MTELEVLRLEIRALAAEQRLGFAELGTRISTLIDSVADLRREYQDHFHPED